MSANEQKEAAALEKLPELETVCPRCEGDTEYNGNPCGPWRPCGVCGGSGYVPTEFGEKVLRLMRRYLEQLERGG
jgi:Tryptophan RNA-binding attenuator protein inhibitory protein